MRLHFNVLSFNLTRILPFLLLPLLSIAQDKIAQDKGVHFDHESSWTAIRAKAKAENKYIFMDCFTTWCGPCRFMSTTIFPQEEAGTWFNDKFINVKVQLDSSAKDDAHVKSWYVDAHNLMTKYDIRAFPTYLIFTPDGQVLHRAVGSTRTVAEFIKNIQPAFDTNTAFYPQLAQYRAGRRDTAFLRKLTEACDGVYDLKDGREIADTYFASVTDLYTPGTLSLLINFTESTADRGFPVFAEHADKVDQIMGKGIAEDRVSYILMRTYQTQAGKAADGKEPDWNAMQKSMNEKYPAYAAEVTAKAKVLYYKQHNDWAHFQTAIVAYMTTYGTHATNAELNDYAWTVFQNCPDMTCVADALEWSKRSFQDQPDAGFMDTYANILYKMGKKDDAITWEQKAADLTASTDEKAGYQATIDKMKKGEKTWN
jgi:thioredoxin-related protein